MDLSGVFIPAATPFDSASGDLDLSALQANLGMWLTHPVRGIVICGSTGEAVYLDESERAALLAAAREAVPSDRLLLMGTGVESTRGTLRLTRQAAEAGADAVMVQPPAFFKPAMTPAVLRDHYLAIADASTLPVIIYQVPPRFSTVEVVSELVAELSHHPNIVGIKDSRGDIAGISELVGICAPGFQVLSGSGLAFHGALEAGAAGGILGVANVAPALSAGVFHACRAGDEAGADRQQAVLDPLHREIIAARGVAGVKAALDFLGMHGGSPRAPLPPLSADGVEVVRGLLAAAGLAVAASF